MILLLCGGPARREPSTHGGDRRAINRRLQAVKDEADGGTGMLLTNLTTVDASTAKPHEILAPALSPPFLAPARVVVVEGLLERFEGRGDQRAPRNVEGFEPLFAALESGLPPTTVLVFLGGAYGRANPVVDRLRKVKGVQVEEYPEPRGQDLFRYIRDEAAARGLRFRAGPSRRHLDDGHEREAETDPAILIANLLQGDTLAIANELDKLALYTMGGDVTVDTVAEVCAGERDATVFEFVDAAMDGDLRKALACLERLRRGGISEQELLAQLVAGYRRAAIIVDLLDSGATVEEIGAATRLQQYQRLRDQAIARARRLGLPSIRAAYECIVDADRANKLGEVDEDYATDILLLRLVSDPGTPAPRR